MDKFKAYQQQMEKALRAFEYTTEWADLVNALGKVNKVLLNYSQFSKIPCDAILGRRLAQCLHPGLPNGVQLKALETYDLLFKAIGSDNLMQELSKFSNGLFPLLSHADLNVKPALLGLYEQHFLPLNERLRPALDGFLIATLHGLEENTDFYQRTDDLLLQVCAGVGPEYFYGSLWRCILIDPSVRLHGMNFLITHFNKKRPLEDQLHILGNSLDALIEAICVSLLDIRNVLVQRAALDLLLCCLPLHNKHIVKHDMIKLVTGAVTVLLRRDTSLSRRLLAWVFNLESSGGKKASNLVIYHQQNTSQTVATDSRKTREQREKERKVSYFNEYARPLLLEAFNNCLSNPSIVIDIPNCWSNLGDYWCYRLLICLIDHAELCELLLDDICLEILRSLCIDFRPEDNDRPEFTRTIKLLLTSMNISYLWGRVFSLLEDVFSERRKQVKENQISFDILDQLDQQVSNQSPKYFVKNVGAGPTSVMELCSAFNFIMECFPIENYLEIAKDFLPKVLINLLNSMIENCDILKVNEYQALTEVVANIFRGVHVLQNFSTSLLNETELAKVSQLNQMPAPISNMIPFVAEDEEYLAEEAIEPTNYDSSNNVTDESLAAATPVAVASATTCEKFDQETQSKQLDGHESGDESGPITPELLIDRFQSLFHNFVTVRLLRQANVTSVYEQFEKLLAQRHLHRGYGLNKEGRVEVNPNFVGIYESLCKIFPLISKIPSYDGSETGMNSRMSKCKSPLSTQSEKSLKLESIASNSVRDNSLSKSPANEAHEDGMIQDIAGTNKPSAQQLFDDDSINRMTYDSCKPYIKDLMLLSFQIDNTKINYASMNLLLGMLSSSKLLLDEEFAQANQLVGSVAPSFSEELNASVVGDVSRIPCDNETNNKENFSKRQMLRPEEFHFIFNDTCWFSLVMEVLWDNLSAEPIMWLKTVNLIQNMHNLTYQTLVCEDIICASLNSSDEGVAYEARGRFMLLFSLLKSERSDLDLRQREFERPLFFMLDSLANKMDPFNCVARDWLTQVYKFKTTARVLEPIIRILLNPDTARTPIIFTKINISSIHHAHMHLYSQVYDSQRILYALNTLWNVLTTDPHQGLIRMANASIRGCHELHLLYARHCNTLTGNSFHDEVTIDNRGEVPSFLELSIVTCLNFLSSYYMLLPSVKLSQADLHGNHKVRMLSCEILRTIFSNLFEAIKGCPAQAIYDMLNRCKAQETVLLLIATSVQCAQHAKQNFPQSHSEHLIHFNETSHDNSDDFQRTLLRLLEELMILEYRVAPANVVSELDQPSRSTAVCSRAEAVMSYNELKYFHNYLISSQRLFLAAIKAALQNVQRSDLHINWLSMIETTIPISGKSMKRWITCIISQLCVNLEMISKCVLDTCETTSINSSMTPKYLLILLNSLSHLTHFCLLDNNGGQFGSRAGSLSQRSESLSTLLPSSMNTLSVYSGASGGGGASGAGSAGGVNSGSTTTLTSTGASGPSSLGPVSHVMSNILHVFSNDQGQESGIGSQTNSGLGQSELIIPSRKEILNKLNDIIFSLIHVWKAMSIDREQQRLLTLGVSAEDSQQQRLLILGAPPEVRKQILSLLSPISLRHGVQFMNAVALVWHKLRSKQTSKKGVIPPSSPDQHLLVQIVASISDLPMESVLQTTRQVISKTQESSNPRRAPLEVSLLQFFLEYIRLFPGSQLIECWKPLLHLLRDGLQLGRPAMPQAQFTLLALLHEFVQTAPLIEDRKDQKDLQDVAQRLIDSLTTVVRACLVQTRWLRRAPEVEPGRQLDMSEDDEINEQQQQQTTMMYGQTMTGFGGGSKSLQHETGSIFSGESRSSEHFSDAESAITTTGVSITTLSSATTSTVGASTAAGAASASGGAMASTGSSTIASSTTTNGHHHAAADDNSAYAASVQALNALAEYVAPVLDVVYASDEKEKVVNLINLIMYFVNPFLKNHQDNNRKGFLACSHLLSSISGYQYTRKAWRKDTLELLLDPQFFIMESECIEHWRIIVDHLMTHDKVTFRDFLSRMSLNQSGGALKLFASRDQENEQRAQLIKRMAFILFCSERDQYHKYTPEIQEKLIESLRDNPSDLVQSQIMLCFRVLIIRSSAHLLTSLWPFVYTEMVQGLLDIEAYLEQNIMAAAAMAAANSSNNSTSNREHQSGTSTPTTGTHGGTMGSATASQLPSGLQLSASTSARFQLFLYTCKLLDMVLALPADSLPQFQMYRWSFIGAGDDFEPHLVRIERRLTELSQCPTLLPYRNHYPILTQNKINNLLDLHPFFKTLVKVNRNEYEMSIEQNHVIAGQNDGATTRTHELSAANYDDPIKFIDAILESDFLVQ